ncbi:hypothetical protein C8R45DRAFT_231666 [Mycena sanguinolenta]|nr:hypothetical protein C8R45DRAFT_231666 [Mycena sanguinolenta]
MFVLTVFPSTLIFFVADRLLVSIVDTTIKCRLAYQQQFTVAILTTLPIVHGNPLARWIPPLRGKSWYSRAIVRY